MFWKLFDTPQVFAPAPSRARPLPSPSHVPPALSGLGTVSQLLIDIISEVSRGIQRQLWFLAVFNRLMAWWSEPRRGDIRKPRATPWESGSTEFIALKGRHDGVASPLQGSGSCFNISQGVALGFLLFAPLGLTVTGSYPLETAKNLTCHLLVDVFVSRSRASSAAVLAASSSVASRQSCSNAAHRASRRSRGPPRAASASVSVSPALR